MYRPLLFIHRWSGIIAAAFLVVAGLTGSAIAFRAELERMLNADSMLVEARGEPLDADALVAAISSRYRDAWISGVMPGSGPREAWAFTLAKPGARPGSYAPSLLYVDPYSGEVIGTRTRAERGLDRQRILGVLFELHHDLMLGLAGHWILAVSGTVWILLSLIGVYLAVRSRGVLGALRISTARGTSGLLLDLHRSLGLATVVAVLAIALSGLHLSVRQEFAALVGLFSALASNPERTLPDRDSDADAGQPGLERAMAVATAALPGSRVQSVSVLPGKGVYRVRLARPGDVNQRGDHQAYVDMRDGRLVLMRNLMQGSGGDVFLAWQRPLHTGEAFGLPGRILVCLAGLLPAGLAGTGLYLWWRRGSSRQRARGARSDRRVAAETVLH